MPNKNLLMLPLLLLLCIIPIDCNELMRVTPNETGTILIYNSWVGLALNWTCKDYSNRVGFTNMFDNFYINANYHGTLSINLRPTGEVDYMCPANDTNCKVNVTSTNITWMGKLFYDFLPQPYIMAGIQFERINNTRINSFVVALTAKSFSSFVCQFGEGVDEYVTKGLRPVGYDMQAWLAEVDQFMNMTTASSNDGIFQIAGPGVSVRSTDWIKNMSMFFTNCKSRPLDCYFTVTMNFFENDTDCNITNMLSETYLRKRIDETIMPFRHLMNDNNVAISLLKLHYGKGIDGITNTFAATLWALDFYMEWISMNGTFIQFDAQTHNSSKQSPFTTDLMFNGTSPVNISAIYYAMLMFPLIVDGKGQRIQKINIENPSNHNIKVYSFRFYPTHQYLIINKDTNPALSGHISICTGGSQTATYSYLQASQLGEKTNINIEGYSFNTTVFGRPQAGIYTVFKAQPVNGCYQIPIRYSQVALVRIPEDVELVSMEEFLKPTWQGRIAWVAVWVLLVVLLGW